MKNYYITEDLDESIILTAIGGVVDGRMWCVGVRKNDKTHRMRNFDGFYSVEKLEKIIK